MRLPTAILLLASSRANADDSRCGAFSAHPPEHPLLGQLRWDVAGVAGLSIDGPRFDGELALGVTKIVDFGFQSVDVGLHGTLGGAMTSPRSTVAAAELGLRWYPVKLRQAFGIDECGDGTKTRRWSEHSDGVGYVALRAGYGHASGDEPSHDAMLVITGVGYEWNVGEGRLTSTFIEVVWRADAIGNHATTTMSGPFVLAGLRF